MQTELKPAEQQEVQELEAQAAPETEVPAEETNAPSRKKKKEKSARKQERARMRSFHR